MVNGSGDVENVEGSNPKRVSSFISRRDDSDGNILDQVSPLCFFDGEKNLSDTLSHQSGYLSFKSNKIRHGQ